MTFIIIYIQYQLVEISDVEDPVLRFGEGREGGGLQFLAVKTFSITPTLSLKFGRQRAPQIRQTLTRWRVLN